MWLRELRNAADSNSSLLDCLVLVGNKVGESVLVAHPATRKHYTKHFNVIYVDIFNSREIRLADIRTDLPNIEISSEEQQANASRMELASSARVSAKTGEGVDKAFEGLILRVYEVEHGRVKEVVPPAETPSSGITLSATKAPLGPEQSECCA